MLGLEEAQAKILANAKPLAVVTVPLADALHRVAARALFASRPSPGFDNSAVDGYALRAADVAAASRSRPVELAVVGMIQAGGVPERPLASGDAQRIFTGAAIPKGADAVVRQEATERVGNVVRLSEAVVSGHELRRRGEDLAVGDPILAAGSIIKAGEINVLASQGRAFAEVFARPRVAILPTGDELREIDLPLGPGEVPNSNSHGLAAQVDDAGGTPVRLAVAPDDVEGLRRLLDEAARVADVIVTSGGVSVGDFDLVRQVVGESGAIDFWQVAIKPGKPLAYGRVGGVPFIGLPGNPVSSYVGFELFVRPVLLKLAGRTDLFRPRRRLRLGRTLRRDGSRRELVRARLEERDGESWAIPNLKQGSGQLSSLLNVQALIDVAAGDGEIMAGELVEALILDSSA